MHKHHPHRQALLVWHLQHMDHLREIPKTQGVHGGGIISDKDLIVTAASKDTKRVLWAATATRRLKHASMRERTRFVTRQPPIGEKDDYDSENFWISDGLPSSSRRRRRGEGRGEGGEWIEKWSASEVNVAVDGAKSEIKVKRTCDPG